VEMILDWADEHKRATGTWPTVHSGPVAGADEETWPLLNQALRRAYRGLPGGSSLAKTLQKYRDVLTQRHKAKLTESQVLAWAEAWCASTGRWPNVKSGTIPGTAGDTWSAVGQALVKGQRGLPGGSSLAKLRLGRR